MFRSIRFELEAKRFQYLVNETERTHSVWPAFVLNGQPAEPSAPVSADDEITLIPATTPEIGKVVGFCEQDIEPIEVIFNGITCAVPTRRYTLTLNGAAASLNDPAPDGGIIEFTLSQASQPTLADVLLAAEFNPGDLPSAGGITVVVNNKVAEYTAIIKNGDKIDIVTKESPK